MLLDVISGGCKGRLRPGRPFDGATTPIRSVVPLLTESLTTPKTVGFMIHTSSDLGKL